MAEYISRNEGLPSKAFSLLYLATHELEVSLNSATAEAMLGSFFSILMVVLTLLITSEVSFMYSASSVAHAGVTGSSNAGERIPAANDKKSRRRIGRGMVVVAALVVEVVVVVGLVSFDLTGVSGFGVEVVGVIKVGEAMIWFVD